jgi:hypothetical protein
VERKAAAGAENGRIRPEVLTASSIVLKAGQRSIRKSWKDGSHYIVS